MLASTFHEKQYLGLNKNSLSRRLVIGIFCFFAFYFSTSVGTKGDIYFFIGICIILISILLLFILHFETKIINGSLILDGIWTSRKVKIDLQSIESCKKVNYSKYILNRSVYNLHRKGIVRFYTRGNEAIELVDRDGLKYLIGSQNASELHKVVNTILNK